MELCTLVDVYAERHVDAHVCRRLFGFGNVGTVFETGEGDKVGQTVLDGKGRIGKDIGGIGAGKQSDIATHHKVREGPVGGAVEIGKDLSEDERRLLTLAMDEFEVGGTETEIEKYVVEVSKIDIAVHIEGGIARSKPVVGEFQPRIGKGYGTFVHQEVDAVDRTVEVGLVEVEGSAQAGLAICAFEDEVAGGKSPQTESGAGKEGIDHLKGETFKVDLALIMSVTVVVDRRTGANILAVERDEGIGIMLATGLGQVDDFRSDIADLLALVSQVADIDACHGRNAQGIAVLLRNVDVAFGSSCQLWQVGEHLAECCKVDSRERKGDVVLAFIGRDAVDGKTHSRAVDQLHVGMDHSLAVDADTIVAVDAEGTVGNGGLFGTDGETYAFVIVHQFGTECQVYAPPSRLIGEEERCQGFLFADVCIEVGSEAVGIVLFVVMEMSKQVQPFVVVRQRAGYGIELNGCSGECTHSDVTVEPLLTVRIQLHVKVCELVALQGQEFRERIVLSRP